MAVKYGIINCIVDFLAGPNFPKKYLHRYMAFLLASSILWPLNMAFSRFFHGAKFPQKVKLTMLADGLWTVGAGGAGRDEIGFPCAGRSF